MGETRTVACPHCGLDTMLFVPQGSKSPPPPPPTSKPPTAKPPQDVGVEIKRGMNPLGVASLVLGIVACVFCWIPFLGLLAIPLAAIGLLLAVIGITAAIVGKKSSPTFPVGGAVVCTAAILIALFVTGGISALIAKGKQTNQEQVSNSGQQTPLSAAGEWSKSHIVKQGDVQIKIEDWTELGGVKAESPSEPGGWATYNNLFTMRVVLSNLSKTRKIDFTTWRGEPLHFGKDCATLSDDNGNVYKQINFEGKPLRADWNYDDYKNETTIYPQTEFTDLLVFEQPVKNLKWLHLELPANNFGGSGMIRFEISPDEQQGWRMPSN